MAELYHCFYKEPIGDAILASCFREVNGQEKKYLFAATHLTKALAFAFSYHDNEVLLNGQIQDTPNEMVIICGGQETLDKARHIRVYGFPDDGFVDARGRQAVSENPMPFSRARLVMETRNIDDLMKEGLQIFLLPGVMDQYAKPDGSTWIYEKYFESRTKDGEALSDLMKQQGARWVNRERGIGVCNVLASEIAAADATTPSSSPEPQQPVRPVHPSP